MKNRLFHYTVGIKIGSIITDGQIKLETSGGVSFQGQRPAVWCSFNDNWEEICNKGSINSNGKHKLLSKLETEKMCEGLFRIEINPEAAPHNWESWKKHSNVSKSRAISLKNTAVNKGSDINLWRVSFDPIKKEDWISIEMWNGSKKIWEQDILRMTLGNIDK